MLKKISYSSFMLGFISCFTLMLIVLVTTMSLYLNKGITVTIDFEEVSPMVVEQVSEIIEMQLPFFVENLKKEIPYIVDAEMTGQINNASIRIGDMEYPLPRDSIKGIEDTFKSQVQIAMFKLLEGLDEEVVAKSISQDVAIRLDQFIDERVHNQTFIFNPISKLTLPVTISVDTTEKNK